MAGLVIDERDQEFVLFDMLKIPGVFSGMEAYREYTKELIEMTLRSAGNMARKVIYPTLMESDREGCRLEKGEVHVPRCFHDAKKKFIEGGWHLAAVPAESGGQGFPYALHVALSEGFIHNFSFYAYIYLSIGAARLIDRHGSAAQKKKYMEKMYSGLWGGCMALTEPEAGSDVGSLKTRAVRRLDGSFRITGTKIFITGADSDLYENIIIPVLARIEGDPPGTGGISIFLVPKYIVNDDGSLGKRNDYVISSLEHKMGLRASSTCMINFGDGGDCYGELLFEERKGMRVMFELINSSRVGVGLQGLGTAGAAYLQALNYARERKQGPDLMNFKNPDSPRVPIIEHPDVRRMLLWMKSHVEGMRALIYFCGFCFDMARTAGSADEKEKWEGFLEVLTPVCKAYCSDTGFRVTEYAMQVFGGYGYCQDHPIEQFMRDLKAASLYEGTNGIQALDLIGRKIGMKGGRYFINLLGEMNSTMAAYSGDEALRDIRDDLKSAVDLLGETAGFFARCGKEGNFFVPVTNAYPFLTMMGTVTMAWLLFWQSGAASEKLRGLYERHHIPADNKNATAPFISENSEAAFLEGKIISARYFIKNVLPAADSLARGIKSGDLSVMDICDESFGL